MHIDTLDYPPAQGEWVQCVPVGLGGVLDRLQGLAEELGKEYGWHEYQAVAFVLTGRVPPVLGIRVTTREGTFGSSITLTADPVVTPKRVRDAYSRIRCDMVGPQVNIPKPKNLEMAVFAYERRQKGDKWGEVRAAWNQGHPEWEVRTEGVMRTTVGRAWNTLDIAPPRRGAL